MNSRFITVISKSHPPITRVAEDSIQVKPRHCQLLDKHLYWSLLPETPLPSLLPWQGLLNLSINITSLESPSQGPHPLFWVYCQICHPHRPAGAGRLGCDDHGNFIPDGRAWRSQELRAPGRHAVQVCLLIHLFPARLSRACCVQGPAWVLEPQPGTTGSLTSALESLSSPASCSSRLPAGVGAVATFGPLGAALAPVWMNLFYPPDLFVNHGNQSNVGSAS